MAILCEGILFLQDLSEQGSLQRFAGGEGYMKCIVKRKGHEEKFSEKKLYMSCYYACKSAHLGAKECAKISKETVAAVKKGIGGKKCVTAHALHIAVRRFLKKRNADAAFMYDTHKDIS